MPVTFHNADAIPNRLGLFSHVARVPAGTTLLVLAGQTGARADGALAADVASQYEQAAINVRTILESQGASARDIFRLTAYLVEPLELPELSRIRRSVFGDIAPASTLLFVPRLADPRMLVEIDCWAAAPEA